MKRPKPLSRHVLSALIGVSVIPLLILVVSHSYRNWHARTREAEVRLQAVTRNASTRTEEYIDKHVKAIESMAQMLGESHGSTASMQRILLKYNAIYDGFTTMLVANEAGTTVAASVQQQPSAMQLSIADRDYFQASLHRREVFVSEVFRGRGFGSEPIIAISSPVQSRNREFSGVVEGSLNLSKLDQLAAEYRHLDVDLVVLDRNRRVIFATPRTGLTFLQSMAGSPLLQALRQARGGAVPHNGDYVVEAENSRGWKLIAMHPVATADREASGILWSSGWWLIASLTVCVILARFIAHRVTRPLLSLVDRVQELTQAGETRSCMDDMRGASLEVVKLAASFDTMASELSRTHRGLRQVTSELEDRVQERTRDLAASNAALQAEVADRIKVQETLVLRDRAIAATSEGIAITDCSLPGNPVVWVNPGFERLTGYSAAEIIGKNPRVLQGPETDPKTIQELREAIRERRHCTVEILNYHKDGSKFWNRLAITPIFNDTGHATHFIGVKSDITRNREMTRLKTELVSTVSHELRTPLTSLRGFAELLLQRDFPRERQKHFLSIIHNEATRLNELINDFLDLQRIESGRETYRFAALEACTVIDDAVHVFANHTNPRELTVRVEGDVPPVWVDQGRIHQVLTNLISNAVKFSPAGGEILIGVRRTGDTAVFRVQDHGIGIPADAMPKLFSRFFRVDNSETRAIGGTGLGLELVKRIVEGHAGRVWAESTYGTGSTFFFSVPLAGTCSLLESAPAPEPFAILR